MNITIKNPNKMISKEDSISILKSLTENLKVSKIFLSKKYFFIPNKYESLISTKFNTQSYDVIIDIKSVIDYKIFPVKNKFSFHFDFTRKYWKKRIFPNDFKSFKLIDPSSDKNIFSEYGPKNTDEIFYFPYGFNFRCSGLGKLDQYGFRTEEDRISNKNELTICLLGGSSCWGFDLLYSETFGKLLQDKINKFSKKKFNVKIYNFAQHSHVVLDETITYLLFVQKLNPDFVILHDGFNDLLFGMITDKNLLLDMITYNINHENILQKLNNLKLKNKSTEIIKCKNKPDEIIDSYIFRKKQLKRLIINNKSRVINALQPCIFSKTYLSDREEKILKDKSSFTELYRNIKFLYERIHEKHANEFDINFYHLFNEIKYDCFIDYCHTNEKSEQFISDIYFDFIKKELKF